MVLKRLLGLVFAGTLVFGVAAADVVVRIAPPRVVVEKRGRAPGPGYVWIQGHHNWNGQGYEWAQGKWDRPPQPHSRWVAHRWTHQRNGWVLVDGHWR